MEFIIGRIRSGDNLITKKIIFDKYLRSNVDAVTILLFR